MQPRPFANVPTELPSFKTSALPCELGSAGHTPAHLQVLLHQHSPGNAAEEVCCHCGYRQHHDCSPVLILQSWAVRLQQAGKLLQRTGRPSRLQCLLDQTRCHVGGLAVLNLRSLDCRTRGLILKRRQALRPSHARATADASVAVRPVAARTTSAHIPSTTVRSPWLEMHGCNPRRHESGFH